MLLPFAFVISVTEAPVSEALAATDAPKTLRAAFTLEVSTTEAKRVVRFDPRLTGPAMWQVENLGGKSEALDTIVMSWTENTSADAILFPDNVRERLGGFVELRDAGAAWFVDFQPLEVAGDTDFDLQTRAHLKGRIWLDPVSERFVRVDYQSVGRFQVKGLGRIDRLSQSYVFNQEPELGLTYITAFELTFTGGRGPITRSETISARLLDVEFVFSSPEAMAAWESRRSGTGLAGRRD